MTEKQENIIKTALELFAQDGVEATSTSKIAKTAGVSEGLIFRHFTNKEGLLNTILEIGVAKANAYFAEIASEENAEYRIRKALELPFLIDAQEFNFWRLFYSLKWQRGSMETDGMIAFRSSLADAFRFLNYSDPIAEARLVEALIDGIATEILLKNLDPKPLLTCILMKYNLTHINND
jgi:AcrR family transcriptional regulator